MFRASLCPSSGDRLNRTACGVSLQHSGGVRGRINSCTMSETDYVFLWFIIRHAPLHSAILHAVLISYYIDFTLLYILFSFPWTLNLLSSLLCITKIYCVDKDTELPLVLRCEVLFSNWPGSYLLLNDFQLCAKVCAVEQEVVHWLVFVPATARRF